MKKQIVQLKDGRKARGEEFERQDFEKIKSIFKKWIELNKDLKSLGGRAMNVPDVVSEGLFSYLFNAVRTPKGAGSYDCVMKETGEGVQVKSASIEKDCTSFGPTSTWDLLYFADFAPNGHIDGNVWFYQIESEEIYNFILNAGEGETFLEQQNQKRRPRFSIKERIIKAKSLQPVKKICLID